jgi:subtilisin family serine protease
MFSPAVRTCALLAICASATFLLEPTVAAASALSREVEARLRDSKPGETISVVVTMAEHVDLSRYTQGRTSASALIHDLKETARLSQAPILAWLATDGLRERAQSFWITNCLVLEATPDRIRALVALPGIQSIEMDTGGGADGEVESGVQETATDWNLNLIRIPAVWSTFGLDGTGIVVGSMDTGIDINHPALVGKWRGGTNSWRDIINNLPNPYDDHGHGSHTIGTMVGGDGPGPFTEDIGIAYGARVISAKVLDSNNSFSSSSIVIAGAQWMLDPDGNSQTNDFPHVINNSWFFNSQTFTGFYSAVAAWRAAGIIPVGIVANFGPGTATTRPPGNYNNIMGVAATTISDQVASYSSRGPSPSGASFPLDLRKPDFAAPGDFVRSSLPGGGYASWQGTSMAAPHVAGCAALMLQANPALGYDDINLVIQFSAVDVAAPGYDFDSGYGRLDAFAAVEFIAVPLAVDQSPTAPVAGLRVSPNPFQDEVRIDFSPRRSPSTLEILDVQGRRVMTHRPVAGGSTGFVWDGRDPRGKNLPAGVYFVRLTDAGQVGVETQRLIRIH